ncbi:MAG: hypothetical protein ACFFDN_30460 [Candidatus Hodarchaeota archaeon]
MNREKFEYIKEKYGHVGSWAIWKNEDIKPKSNIADMTILNPDINENLLLELKPNVVLVGYNISRRIIVPFGNFHDKRKGSNDFKIRFAFRGTPYWGAYMTDIIKDFEQKISGEVNSYLRDNPQVVKQNIETFLQELDDIGADDPTLIVFGVKAYDILKRNLNEKFKIVKIPHYSYRRLNNKENYKKEVENILKQINLER